MELLCGFAEMYVANIHSGDYANNGYDYIITSSDTQTRNTELYLAEVSRKCHRAVLRLCGKKNCVSFWSHIVKLHRQIFFWIVKNLARENTLNSPLLTLCCIFYFLIEWIMSTVWTNQGIDINFRSIWPQHSRMPKLCDLSSRCRRIDPWQSNCPKGSTVNTKNRDWSISAAPGRSVWPWPPRRNRSEQLEPQRRHRARLTSRESSRRLLEATRLNEESLHHLLLRTTVTRAVMCDAQRRLDS